MQVFVCAFLCLILSDQLKLNRKNIKILYDNKTLHNGLIHRPGIKVNSSASFLLWKEVFHKKAELKEITAISAYIVLLSTSEQWQAVNTAAKYELWENRGTMDS